MLKRFLLLLTGLFLLTGNITAQKFKSIHQIEYEKFKCKNYENLKKGNDAEIIPLKIKTEKSLSKTVFGYYPYWEYSRNSHLYFKYNLLTHLAAFAFNASSNGSVSDPSGWPWTNVINDSHSNGVKVIMVIVNFDKDEIHNIITNSTARWIFMNSVKSKIKQYKLDGVNIDFEGLYKNDRGSTINGFMKELSDTVHNISSALEVSFAAPAVNWGGWNLEGLAASCDYLFIMGYDFFGSWSSTTGPTAPLTGGYYNVTNTLEVQYKNVTENNPDKLILGVPYYGPHWETESAEEGANILYDINSNGEKVYKYQPMFYRDAHNDFETYGTLWSSKYKNSWYGYLQGFTNHQVWIDNDTSLSLKYDLALSKNLKGVGMWALGYDGNYPELWSLLEEKLVTVEKNRKLPDNFLLKQNYPNPFNPSTTIQYSIPLHSFSSQGEQAREEFFVTLKIFNVLGTEIATLINRKQKPGTYKVTFNGTGLPSGTYYYQLRSGNYSETKKMILIK